MGALVFSSFSVLTEPPSLAVSALVAVLYITVVLCGVLVLRLRMFADALVCGPRGARGVALTFDDGPHPLHTIEVLDILDRYSATATFFVIGHKALAHRDVVIEIVRRGHHVGVHGFAHARLFSLWGSKRVRDDLERAVAVVETITGKRPRLFRPPIGHTNPTIVRVAEHLELRVVGWSVSGRDGLKTATARDVEARISRNLKDGDIVLLHDAAEHGPRKPAGVAALEAILQNIEAKNLRVTALSTWLEE